MKVSVHRAVEGRVKTLSVKREGRRWFLVLSCDDVPASPLAPTGSVIGIDVGIASVATTSAGQHIANPRYGQAAAERLGRAQRVLAQTERGSENRKAARQTVAARHRKAARSGLNRSINDAGWGQFVSILQGKAKEAGRAVIDVNPRHISQTCSLCGHVDPANRVSQAVFRWQACGHNAHADINAACNILRAGLTPPAAQAA